MLGPFVDASWWQAHRDEVVTADVRWYLDGRSGREAFEGGHLPGAVFVDLEHCLAGPSSTQAGRHPLPSPGTFSSCMNKIGISSSDTVVAYDDQGGVIAARLVWMLRALGSNAALLDGGMGSWVGEMEEGPGLPRRPGNFPSRPWPPDLLVGPEDLGDLSVVLIDARDPPRYRGEYEPVDPKAGHIPGAVNLPCRQNIDAEGMILEPTELRRRFEALGVTDGAQVVSYCGSGVTACHNLLALEAAGFAAGRLYPGSWSQYSASGAPVETAVPN